MRVVALGLVLVGMAGCASVQRAAPMALPPQAIPRVDGSYYQVQRGDTVWGIARSFGLETKALAKVNRLPDASRLELGQRLFIPLPRDTAQFLWPARGKHKRSIPKGLTFTLPTGSLVRASRTGLVAVATRQLEGWGPTIVLEHSDGYVSIYSGLEKILVSPGTRVPQGGPIGRSGRKGLHFEIRKGTYAKDPLDLLPKR